MRTHVTDTHALVYFLLDPEKLGRRAREVFESPNSQVHIPTMALLEVKYLIEIGRLETSIEEVLAFVESSQNFHIQPFDSVALRHSLAIEGQRDPFDRIILSTAMSLKLPLITRDRWMRSVYNKCVW